MRQASMLHVCVCVCVCGRARAYVYAGVTCGGKLLLSVPSCQAAGRRLGRARLWRLANPSVADPRGRIDDQLAWPALPEPSSHRRGERGPVEYPGSQRFE